MTERVFTHRIKRGPFGLTTGERVLSCQCSGCCGMEMEEWPEELWATVTSTSALVADPVDAIVKLHKSTVHLVTCSSCGEAGAQVITYRSDRIETIYSDNYPSEDSESCCLSFELTGSCHSGAETTFPVEPSGTVTLSHGECRWILTVFWSGGDPLNLVEDVTSDVNNPNYPEYVFDCGTKGLLGEFGGIEHVPACILGASAGLGGYRITITEDQPEGSEALPCPYACCPETPAVIYGTVTSSCPAMDGLVFRLENVGGDVWSSISSPLGCCDSECGVLVLSLLRDIVRINPASSAEHAGECTYTMILEGEGSRLCVSKFIWTTPECLPQTISGLWSTGGSCSCCDTGDSFSVEFTN